jgi:hypothetical protein
VEVISRAILSRSFLDARAISRAIFKFSARTVVAVNAAATGSTLPPHQSMLADNPLAVSSTPSLPAFPAVNVSARRPTKVFSAAYPTFLANKTRPS